uniref:Uncharacterized protein n=1 Tax=Parascaris univalens TaxID=6257 RepID=A0A914ZU76_PARUN
RGCISTYISCKTASGPRRRHPTIVFDMDSPSKSESDVEMSSTGTSKSSSGRLKQKGSVTRSLCCCVQSCRRL